MLPIAQQADFWPTKSNLRKKFLWAFLALLSSLLSSGCKTFARLVTLSHRAPGRVWSGVMLGNRLLIRQVQRIPTVTTAFHTVLKIPNRLPRNVQIFVHTNALFSLSSSERGQKHVPMSHAPCTETSPHCVRSCNALALRSAIAYKRCPQDAMEQTTKRNTQYKDKTQTQQHRMNE